METFKQIAGIATITIAMVLGFGALFAVAVVWLWNQTMPELFGLHTLTYWQALCLSWLSTLLLKSFSPPSTKGEEQLKEIVALHRRQETLLDQVTQLQERQIDALDEMKSSLQSIDSILERTR